MDLQRAIYPTDGIAHRGFGLDEDEGKAVDQQHHVGAALGGPGAEDVLGGEQVLVVVIGRAHIVVVDELDGDVLMVAAKGHGLLIAEPAGEQFIGADKPLAAHGQNDGP